MRQILIYLVLGSLLVVLPACRRGGALTSGAAPEASWSPIAPEAVAFYGNAGGLQDSVRMVVRDPAALLTVWNQATARQSNPPPLPPVDFTREMVIVVGAGQMTPEDEIHVDSVMVRRESTPSGGREQTMSVLVRTHQGCGRFRSSAYPVEIVRVPRFEGPVRFIERRERATSC